MSGVATNRTNIDLPSEVSAEILQKVQQESAVMRLAPQMPLPGRGATMPVITSDPEASWVTETGQKPISNPGLGTKLMQGYMLSVIVPFSNQFRRDAATLYDALIARLPRALGLKFDQTVIGAVEKPGENFDNFAACTAQSLIASGGHTPYLGLVNAKTDIATQGGVLDAFMLSPAAVGLLLSATDTTERPIFVLNTAEGGFDRLLGARTIESRGAYKSGSAAAASSAGSPAIIGVAGDWSQARWGTVEGLQVAFADQATLTINSQQVDLFSHNMFAVRAEIELGFRADTSCFNLLTGAIPQA